MESTGVVLYELQELVLIVGAVLYPIISAYKLERVECHCGVMISRAAAELWDPGK